MNLDDKDEKAVAELAEKEGCSLAAARLKLTKKDEGKKPQK